MTASFRRWVIAWPLSLTLVGGLNLMYLLYNWPALNGLPIDAFAHACMVSSCVMVCGMFVGCTSFTWGMLRVQRAAARAMKRLLGASETEDPAWSEVTAEALKRMGTMDALPVALAAAETLGRVGDGRDIADVEWTVAHSRLPGMRAAADRILPILRERAHRAEDAARLLRPADAPGADTLLRPASGPTEADPAVLLRAGDAPEIDDSA
jgi:hypothetical protein